MASEKRAKPSRQEPVFWSLFSGGGIVAAFLFPVTVLILGIALPAGWLPTESFSYDRIIGLVRHPLTKIFLGVLVALPFFHAAHRARFTIHHKLGIHGAKRFFATACYGGALLGTAATVWVLARI